MPAARYQRPDARYQQWGNSKHEIRSSKEILNAKNLNSKQTRNPKLKIRGTKLEIRRKLAKSKGRGQKARRKGELEGVDKDKANSVKFQNK